MPKGFTLKQREKINQTLLNVGRDMFGQFGLKKTSIADITKATGISQGAFYQFYPSKEMLYYAVLKEEEVNIKKQLMNEVLFIEGELKENLKKLMLWTLEIADTNPFIKQMMELKDVHDLMASVPEETSQEHQVEDEDFFMSLLNLWQADSSDLSISPEVLVGIFGLLFTLPLNKKLIGETKYDETKHFLVRALVDSIIK